MRLVGLAAQVRLVLSVLLRGAAAGRLVMLATVMVGLVV
jgi:hypothetical protein